MRLIITEGKGETMPLFCTKCGSKRDEDAVFCIECGNNFDDKVESKEEVQQIAPIVEENEIIEEKQPTEAVETKEEVEQIEIIAEKNEIIEEKQPTDVVETEIPQTKPDETKTSTQEVKNKKQPKEKKEEPKTAEKATDKKAKKVNLVAILLTILLLGSWSAFAYYYFVENGEKNTKYNQTLQENKDKQTEIDQQLAEIQKQNDDITSRENEILLKIQDVEVREAEIIATLQEIETMQTEITEQLLDLEQQKTEFFEEKEAFSNTQTTFDYILPNSDKEFIDPDVLKNLTKEELVYARNEIYARYGNAFSSENIKTYFESKSWYENLGLSVSFINFNEFEVANVQLIQAEEDLR